MNWARLGIRVVCAAAIKAEREEEERRREERRRRHALESKRNEDLTNYVEKRQHDQKILEVVSAVESKLNAGDYEDREAGQDWVDWARDYADRLDPLSKGLPRLLQFDDFNPRELR